jgi:hypothetical protein
LQFSAEGPAASSSGLFALKLAYLPERLRALHQIPGVFETIFNPRSLSQYSLDCATSRRETDALVEFDKVSAALAMK